MIITSALKKKSGNQLDMEIQISMYWDINSPGYLLFWKILRIIWSYLHNKLWLFLWICIEKFCLRQGIWWDESLLISETCNTSLTL